MKRNVLDKSEKLRKHLNALVVGYENEIKGGDLRRKVLALIPIVHSMRELGKSLIPKEDASSARDRIIYYFKKYSLVVINGDELLVVSGIQEYARRIRELRVQYGWSIVSGSTMNEMLAAGENILEGLDLKRMKVDDYILVSNKQDKESAFRWHIANDIRKSDESMRNKILNYLKKNVGKPVTSEELRYVAGDKTEWARRVRELRTEYGWPIVTKNKGLPDLPVGSYLLESLRQSPEHDRHIPDPLRGEVLRRDKYKCVDCGWEYKMWNKADPRHLELHHIKEHAKGGENSKDNLRTLCAICHKEYHTK